MTPTRWPRRNARLLGALWLACALAWPAVAAEPVAPLISLRGSDFVGGAAELFGARKFGVRGANYVYAAPNGPRSTMSARFEVAAIPEGPLALHVRARLDDRGTPCPIRISLNGAVVFEGPDSFAHADWQWRVFALPAGALTAGANELTFANTSAEGAVGMPPWFMLATCALAPPEWTGPARPSLEQDFRVDLPPELRPLPEPLGPEHKEPGFRWRGTKGWMWRPEQYLAEIPTLARYKMNFLMNCYGSMCDIEHYGWGTPDCNRWWEPLPVEKRAAYERVVRECQSHGIEFCFSLNPNISSRRAVDYDSPEDLELVWQHYEWMLGLGVRWFNIQFDDISQGMDPSGQARLANTLLERLRKANPRAELILCPVYYWGTGQDASARPYLETLARELHGDVYVFWTGDGVVGRITRKAAESYRAVVGHRLFMWDNYPVNDGAPTLHLGPLMKRDADLCEVADGYMSNPMHTQNEANRIPLLTVADYAYNPWAYDPARSIGQAILHLSRTRSQAAVLRDLVELYPGMVLFDQGTGYNPAIDRFEDIIDTPHSRFLAGAYLRHASDIVTRLKRSFPSEFTDARATLEGNLESMRAAYREAYGTEPSA